MPDDRVYLAGFGNAHASEAVPGTIPEGQNTPRKAPHGLYPEQISGTTFVHPRHVNARTWVYRIRPSLAQSDYRRLETQNWCGDFDSAEPSPNLRRWKPQPIPESPTDFLDGLETLGGCGSASMGAGYAVLLYAASQDMERRCFYDADGDLLLVPQLGRLCLQTELGVLDVAPGEIAVLPRGLKARVALPDGQARGYVLEAYDGAFRLPDRGPIGANGLADERHFLAPSASFEDDEGEYRIVAKSGGTLYETRAHHSPFDVVGWHGNWAPYKYDLLRFNAIGSVSFDHPDPSIGTVLTAPRAGGGGSSVDLVVFAPRWEVATNTFRPPYYHRNRATEINGIIRGGVAGKGYEAGCVFVTPPFTPHGLGPEELARALKEGDEPVRPRSGSLWFQFESSYPMRLTPTALESPRLDANYLELFEGLPSRFDPSGGS